MIEFYHAEMFSIHHIQTVKWDIDITMLHSRNISKLNTIYELTHIRQDEIAINRLIRLTLSKFLYLYYLT